MNRAYRIRRTALVAAAAIALGAVIIGTQDNWRQTQNNQAEKTPTSQVQAIGAAMDALMQLEVKGRAPKTGYTRTQFGDGWDTKLGCDTRNIILHRDLVNVVTNEKCQVVTGLLHDPYTGRDIQFQRGATTSDDVQIDHVVALSDAWQKGAQQLSPERRKQLANDPLELLAVDGEANQKKSDSDAATWLPPNKAFRCQYVARQIAVKATYGLWVTQAEREAMINVLESCPGQQLPAT